jgi:cytochrome c5
MKRGALIAVVLGAGIVHASLLYAQTAAGAAVYEKYCAQCHDQVTARIPTRDASSRTVSCS